MSASTEILAASIAFGIAFAALIGSYAVLRRPAPRQLIVSQAASGSAQKRMWLYEGVRFLARFPVSARLTGYMDQRRVSARLDAAGNPGDITALEYIRFKIALVFITGFIFLALGLTSLLPAAGAAVLFAIFATALWLLPDWYLAQLQRNHVEELNRSVPDLVDLLAVSIEGGLSLDPALRQVAIRFPPPLGVELRRAMSERNQGKPLAEALKSISERTGAEEFRRFITPFLQAYTEGGKTAENMRALSEDMRERRKQRAQERGRRAAAMVLVPMMFCIFPALLITVVGPALMSFFSSIAGR